MYNQDLKKKWDNEAVLAYREEKGIEKGIEKGEHNKAVEIAKNLKNEDLSVDLIAKATGLSTDEVEKL